MPSNNRLIKTSIARSFDNVIEREKFKYFKLFEEATRLFSGRYLRIDTYYVFLHSRIIGKKNQVKVIDYLNRQKIAHDSLSKLIQIDDKYFKSGIHELILCEKDSEQCIIFKITIQDKIKTLHELKNELLIKV